ncbi:MAG: ABC transporter permease [Armatimonadetes bacterium]|nr:ABC transporter permease [Armatimonadota bacterium]
MTLIELFTWQVWDITRPRKIAAMAAIGFVGPLFAIIWRLAERGHSPDFAYGIIAPVAVYGFSLVLLTIIFASAAVSGEMGAGTITYILTRPVSRVKVLLAKWLAATAVVSLTVILSCAITATVLYGPSLVGSSALPQDLAVIPVGVAVYSAMFVALSALSNKPWLIAIIYVFLFESWVSLLPGDFRNLSVMAHLRALSRHDPPLEPGQAGAFELIFGTPEQIAVVTAASTLILMTVISLTVACLLFTFREYVPKEETT